MIRVLLLDDHASFRSALAFMLSREPEITIAGEAGSLAEAHAVLSGTAVDVALVDLDFPDGFGLDILEDLYDRNPGAAAVILTGSTRPESTALAVAAGAVGFLHKSTGVAEIVSAIRKVTSGQSLFSPAEAMALMRQATQHHARTEAAQRALAQLTPRERDVLQALTCGLDNRGIADRLCLSTATVRSHVVHLLDKLNVESRLQAALIAVRHELTDHEDPG